MLYSYCFEVEGLQINSFNQFINWLCDLLAIGPIISWSRFKIQLASVIHSTSQNVGRILNKTGSAPTFVYVISGPQAIQCLLASPHSPCITDRIILYTIYLEVSVELVEAGNQQRIVPQINDSLFVKTKLYEDRSK